MSGGLDEGLGTAHRAFAGVVVTLADTEPSCQTHPFTWFELSRAWLLAEHGLLLALDPVDGAAARRVGHGVGSLGATSAGKLGRHGPVLWRRWARLVLSWVAAPRREQQTAEDGRPVPNHGVQPTAGQMSIVTFVRTKSLMRMLMAMATTLRVVALPTPSVPPRVVSP